MGTWSYDGTSDFTPTPDSTLDTDGTLAANSDARVATQKATKTYVDSHVAGEVIGPASATDSHLAQFDGTTGKLLKDGGLSSASFDAAGAAAAAQAASQPLDPDLTAIAALSTLAFGRSVLEQANAAAVRTLIGLGTAATKDSGAAGSAGKVLDADDATTTNSRTPTAHATSHQPGGSDAMAVDAAAATGSLRTLGTGAAQAASGTDSRLSDTRTPTNGTVSKDKLDATTVASPLGVNQTGSVRRGSSSVSGAETTTSTTYVTLTTPDQVQNVVMPSAGLLWVYFRALFKLAGASNSAAVAVFVGGTQAVETQGNAAAVAALSGVLVSTATHLMPFGTDPGSATFMAEANTTSTANDSPNLGSSPGAFAMAGNRPAMPIALEVPAGTYTVDIRYHVNVTSGGTLTVQDRLLLVKAEAYS